MDRLSRTAYSAGRLQGRCRQRWWKKDWVLDLDVRAFFDSVPHDLMMKAVAHHTSERWVLLCISRWLVAPMQMPDGTIAEGQGNPAGIPDLALDSQSGQALRVRCVDEPDVPRLPVRALWDDVIVHCDTEDQARHRRSAIAGRLGSLGLELHPVKTKIVYCKDANRRGDYEHTSFDFLGSTFRTRKALGQRGYFASFNPAISASTKKAKSRRIKAWHLNLRSSADLPSLAREINPIVCGSVNYYGALYRCELFFLAWRINHHLTDGPGCSLSSLTPTPG